MATYTVKALFNRPTFLDIEIEADDVFAAKARAQELIAEHLGPKYVEDFDELVGVSQGQFDGFEIIDVEEVTE